ncbi:MAG: transcription antitermination factor NusB [Deltaproteobacteria bacterium]|nr:transcription antitermination factor NusB [Deltaproteobacteria bacterium]
MSTHTRTKSREYALQFLYQSEMEKLYLFSDSHFQGFIANQQIPASHVAEVREIARGTLERTAEIDNLIQSVSTNWKLERMSVIDRNVLRLATFELLVAAAPQRVVLNEAIELAKKFGSAESGRFVNGLLDRIAKSTPVG